MQGNNSRVRAMKEMGHSRGFKFKLLPLLFGKDAPVGRRLVARQPVEILHFVPIVDGPVEAGPAVVAVHPGVGEVIGPEGDGAAVLDDGLGRHMDEEARGRGRVHPQLLAGEGEDRVGTILDEDRGTNLWLIQLQIRHRLPGTSLAR